ncbi:MAG: hypothetical protein SF069_15855 [Phycisphaerae bacterium]|nr:hypothetical protein [Phycisphaerae bacterium]
MFARRGIELLCIGGAALLTPFASAQTFSNSAPIIVADSGPAGVYPSEINVTGLSGPVDSVVVKLRNIQHTRPSDLDILLVGPGGERILLMSDCGADCDISGVTITFRDGRPFLPSACTLTSGEFRPTNFGAAKTMPAPAPAGPYGFAFANFSGTSGNGTWALYVNDDSSGDGGTVSGGWEISFTTSSTLLYQGQLTTAGVPVDGSADLEFSLFDSPTGGQLLSTQTIAGLSVDDGLFTAPLTFPDGVFDGRARWLEIATRSPAGAGAFVTLTPRQLITPATFALRAASSQNLQPPGVATPALTVASNAAVGIGTTEPGMSLEVTGPLTYYSGVNSGVDAGASWAYLHANGTEPTDPALIWSSPARLRLGAETARGAGFVERMTIRADGNVGIGTANPSDRLQIVGGNLVLESSGSFARAIRNAGTLIASYGIGSTFLVAEGASQSLVRFAIAPGRDADILGDGPFVSNGLDFAEAFKSASADLEPGELVALSLGDWQSCRRTETAYDAHLFGVVSTRPSFIAGMSFEARAAVDPELARERAMLQDMVLGAGDATQEARDRAGLRLAEIDAALSEKVKKAYRPIALSGRVPTKVDGQFGSIRAGDRLTSSPTPGHAMKQSRPGMCVGVALEDFNGAGPGMIMILVQPGWHGGAAPHGDAVETATLATELAELRRLKAELHELIANQALRR